MGEFTHFTRAELSAEAGVDPWHIEQSLAAGSPGKIDAIADGVHRAGVAAGEVDEDFENARKQFRDAWVSDGSRSPIDESAEVAKVTASVGSHRGKLRATATAYEQIATALGKAQREADAEIGVLEQQLHGVDEQMAAADRYAATDASRAQAALTFARALAVHFVQTAGSKVQVTRATYAAVLSDASTVLSTNGAPQTPEVPDPASADPAAQRATDELKRLTDRAVVEQMTKVKSIQKELDAAAADAYVHGPGTAEGDAALAKVHQLKGELASALDDLGNIPDYSRLDPRSVSVGADGHLLGDYSVDGQPVQMYGQLKNGTGDIFDQAKQTTFTFKDGQLVGMSRLDPGKVTPDDELLFNAVTTAVGAPEAAAGLKVAGEVGVHGLQRLLGREGFDLAASGLTSENVLPRALAGAQLQADAAQARLEGVRHFDALPSGPQAQGIPPGIAHGDGLPTQGSGDHLPAVAPGHPGLSVPGELGEHSAPVPEIPPPATIVGPSGEILPAAPHGTVGYPAQNGSGWVYEIAQGTEGIDPRVARIRIMDPISAGRYPYPDGYASYENALGQAVNPITGKTIGRSDPYWHIPLE